MIDAQDQAVVSSNVNAGRRKNKPAAARGATPVRRHAGGSRRAVRIERTFSDAKVKPFDQIEWDRRTA